MQIFLFLSILFISLQVYAADPPSTGTVFKDCDSCPEVIVLAPGSYIRGDSDNYKYERPVQKVTIDYPFALGKYEVTFDEWDACAAEKGCKATPDDHGWGKGRYPIINVTFKDIRDYLTWLSQKTGQTYRLPSETEWEYAARAGTTTEYWWGDEVGVNNANCRNCGSNWSGIGSAPVGSFKPNPWGFHDMNGNAWDWVADCWTPHYALAPTDGSARRDGDCKQRVTRGGSWYYFPKLSRSAYRYKNHVDIFSYNISFRVLREIK